MSEVVLQWFAFVTERAPCPDYKPDPYTGELPATHCLVSHTKRVARLMERSFLDQEAADKFIRSAPPNCHDFKIRSPRETGGQE
jgi:hypothetical protein